MGVGKQCHAMAALRPGKKFVPIVQEAGWASEVSGWAWKMLPPQD